MADPLPEEIDDALWQEVCRRADAIRNVVKGSDEQTSAAEISDLSKELGLSRASVFRLLKLFRPNKEHVHPGVRSLGVSGDRMGTAPTDAVDLKNEKSESHH